MTDGCILGDFRILRPAHTADHAASVRWLAHAHARCEAALRNGDFDQEAFRISMERLIARFGCGPESLARRGHDLRDFLHLDWGRMRIFNLERNPRGAGMAARMEVFEEIADGKLEEFYPPGEEPPGEIIHVTCTGYVAPSAVQKLVSRRAWHERVGIMHAYHMGCYASMPAVKMAAGFLALRPGGAPPTRIDIVHSEACTLHLDPGSHHPEQLVVQSLFSDGHIRYSARPEIAGRPGLRFLASHEELVPGSQGAMGWVLGDLGMRMILSREVPELLVSALRGFVLRLIAKAGADAPEVLKHGAFAVHPGGPRIIDKVAELLELAPARVAASREVLREYGNMSSATLPHIWSRLVDDGELPPGAPVVSLAFGPGLTVYGALLRKV